MTLDASKPNDPAPSPEAPSASTGSASAGAEAVAYPELGGYRLIQELGRSPKGVVYKARRLVEQDVVAVKLFRGEAVRERDFKENLRRQAEASFLLEHPGLARCLGCTEDAGRLLLVQEFARGEALSRALQRNVRFRPPRALNIANHIAQALAYASQRRRFHGRLHPGDVIVHDDEVRVLGVGLGEHPEHAAWNVKDPHLFEPLIYSPPEALPSKTFPEDDAGRRAVDLYALGAILYHMLTGSPPFRGADEASLAEERVAIAPAPARWPRGSEGSLPPRAVALVQQLLSPDPAERGTYDALIALLADALREASGQAPPAPRAAVPLPPLPPAEVLPPRARRASPKRRSGGAPVIAASSAPPASHAEVPFTRPPRSYAPAYEQAGRRREPASPAMLIGAVVLVFGIALGVAAKTFLLSSGSSKHNEAASVERAAAAGARPEPVSTAPAPPQGLAANADREALQTLALIEEMLKSGEARHDTTTLRLVENIVRRTAETTRAGVKARLLKARIEEHIARGGGRSAPPGAPAGQAAPGRTPSNMEEKVFQEHLARARDLAARQRFGAAIEALKALPPNLKMAPFTERNAQAVAKLRAEAKAAFADTLLSAEKAAAAGDIAKARGLYQGVRARYGIPELAAAAARRVQALNALEEKTRREQADQQARAKRAQEMRALGALLKDVVAKAQRFRFAEARDQMKRFAQAARDAELRQLASDYGKLIRDEEWIFGKCRTELKRQIERDPNHASPLQVFSARKKGAPGFDIVDFDAAGITFSASRGAGTGSRTREWTTIHPRQPFVMLQLLIDKSSAQDQLALAVLAFHGALFAEMQAREGKNAGGQAAPRPRRTPKQLLDIATALREDTEKALLAAVQADATARGKEKAQRALMEKIAKLALPKAAP